MSAIGRAIWFIESHFEQEISLEDIAQCAGLSRFHLSRSFGLTTGRSISDYIRARRLSRAAIALSDGAPSILAVALDAGYGSHEAFTRAFRDRFGLTPEEVRNQGHVDELNLLEPIRMENARTIELEPPRFETLPPIRIAGLGAHYDYAGTEGIPSQWQRFNAHFGEVPGQIGDVAYGVCIQEGSENNGFRYITGVEVRDSDNLPPGFETVKLPANTYAIFSHRGHVSGIAATCHAIFTQWLPSSGYRHAEVPDMFERYDTRFDSRTGTGLTEIWIPVTR